MNLNNALFGIIAGVKVTFPLADPSVCHWGVNCPIKNGNTYLQNFTLPVLSVYPSVRHAEKKLRVNKIFKFFQFRFHYSLKWKCKIQMVKQ